jgi:alpha-D-xyloside xylohydrolase
VTEYKARSRSVYLPAGASWYDFYTGQLSRGGRAIAAGAPFERIPLFVRAGSIIPTGPAVEYALQETNPALTLNVYTGANGVGSVYEDDGISRQYLNGKYARIPLRYDEATRTLTIGAREGSYGGMAGTRTIRVRWITPGRPLDLDAADLTVTYSGAPMQLRMR